MSARSPTAKTSGLSISRAGFQPLQLLNLRVIFQVDWGDFADCSEDEEDGLDSRRRQWFEILTECHVEPGIGGQLDGETEQNPAESEVISSLLLNSVAQPDDLQPAGH
ncbi:MAG: hypothetical protein HC835_06265 [Oscillatoriales cyanobacterium RM2_1_1]|nr:hypothetical protein [Oscillatoriales cyanobacterium SM2_3_0]NJO45255.1 hypothetical protein [Oscillatoriales cyanobacterium RM2_1_1]